jgi:RNA polymerase sigma-70 factor (ECF subfamily)
VPIDQNTASDNELVRFALVDRTAFGPIYDRYAIRIYKYCYRRLGNRDDAEDATSAIFIRAIERLSSFRDGSFAAWLFAIARTTVADRFRVKVAEPLHQTYDAADSQPTPLDVAIEAEATQSLFFLIGALPVDQREVIELRLAELTGAEIAEAMGRSVPAVKMLQLRAMKRLREIAPNHLSGGC